MRSVLCVTFLLVSVAASAQIAAPDATTKPPAVDFGLSIKDPRGKAFPMPCAADKPNCSDTWTLGYAAYLSLNTPSQRAQGSPPNPDDMKNAALGYRIYGSTAPVDLTTEERASLKVSLFKALSPAVAYAACRMIVPAEECGK